MKIIKTIIFLFAALILISTGAMVYKAYFSKPQYETYEETPESEEKLIGGDKDGGGCLIGAGYSWCEEKQKCLRPWEEKCSIEKFGYIRDAYIKGGQKFIDFDEALWVSEEEGTCTNEEMPEIEGVPVCNPNGFGIINEINEIRTFQVSTDDVEKASDFEFSDTGMRVIDFDTFTEQNKEFLQYTPYIIEIENNLVINIKEVFIP